MLFNDPLFLFVFLPLTVILAITVRRFASARAVLATLVMASVVFYGWWNPLYLPLLGVLATVNFVIVRAVVAARQRQQPRRVKALVTAGVAFSLAALAYFKYTDFLISAAGAALALDVPLQHIILPLGISFFTFQQIAYLVDASRSDVGKHDFLEYCFFLMFFPQLIAGPIVHHREIFSQTEGPHAFAARPGNVMIGLTIFLIGLFKKVAVADHLAPVASIVFGAADAGRPLDFVDAWIGAGAYSLQLYFDFSGYSDMATGAARLFGIRLPLNFASPYQATGIIDFWRRWHITLSRFLRDYIYIPLGGNRRGPALRYVNLMVTMTIGGLWHGAAWNFVLWGFLHGVYLIINHAWRAVWRPIDTWWSRSIARLVTFAAVVVAFVPFRAPTLGATLNMYRGMINLPHDALSALGEDVGSLLWAVAFILGLWLVPNTQQFVAWFRPALDYDRTRFERDPPLLSAVMDTARLRWRPRLASAIVVGLMAAFAFLSLSHVSEFLYFSF